MANRIHPFLNHATKPSKPSSNQIKQPFSIKANRNIPSSSSTTYKGLQVKFIYFLYLSRLRQPPGLKFLLLSTTEEFRGWKSYLFLRAFPRRTTSTFSQLRPNRGQAFSSFSSSPYSFLPSSFSSSSSPFSLGFSLPLSLPCSRFLLGLWGKWICFVFLS